MPERSAPLWRWLAAGLWALLIFVACSIPSPAAPQRLPFLDKAAHLILFAVLSLFLARSLHHIRSKKSIVLLAAAVSLFYGLLIEIHQSFIPYRSFEYLDLLADGVGAGLGGLFWLKFKGRKI